MGAPRSAWFAAVKGDVHDIGKDQAEDYARRQGVNLAGAERWLRPNLACDPQQPAAPADAAKDRKDVDI